MASVLHKIKTSSGIASILYNGSWQSAAIIYIFLVRLLYVFAVSAFLGPEGYGFFAYIQTYYLVFLPLVQLGLDVILPREIGINGVQAQPLLQRTFSIRLCLGGFFACVAMLAGLATEADASHQLAIALISLTIIPRTFQSWCSSVLLGFERSRQELKLTLLYRSAEVLIGSAVVYFAIGGVLWLVAIHFITWSAYALHNCYYIHRELVALRFRVKMADFKDLLGENLKLTVQMLVESFSRNAILLISRHTMDDLAKYGQLALAYHAIGIVANVLGAFNSAAAPILARSVQRQDQKDIAYTIGATCGLLVLGAACIGVLMLVGEPLVLRAMGQDYAHTGLLLGSMALCLPFYIARFPIELHMQTKKVIWPLTFSYGLIVAVFGLIVFAGDPSDANNIIVALAAGQATAFVYLLVSWLAKFRHC